MQIEFAVPATKQEVEDFFNRLALKNSESNERSASFISANKLLLLNAYFDYRSKSKVRDAEDLKMNQINENCFDKKLCYCGAKLRWVRGYDFFGCINYKNEGKHFSCGKDGPYQIDNTNKYKHWLNSIISLPEIKGNCRASDLYNFYMGHSLPDLRELYFGETTKEKTLDTFIKVKRDSSEFEAKTKLELIAKHPKVIPQFAIKYRLKDSTIKLCFIDFLCSDEKNVFIYECKTNQSDANEDQKNLYTNLIEYMLENACDRRELSFSYLFEKAGL